MKDDADHHEKFIELLTKYEGLIRASIRAVIRRTEDVDEVMQAVSLPDGQRDRGKASEHVRSRRIELLEECVSPSWLRRRSMQRFKSSLSRRNN